MNIIEQYGSYENAKNAFEASKKAKDFFQADIINHALREYRRENGIFEAGDWAVCKTDDYDDCNDGLLEVLAAFNDREHPTIFFEGDCTVHDDYAECFRHATDEEVEAGRQL